MSATYRPARQQVTRIPDYPPGSWVRLRADAGHGLGGKVRRVRSLACAVTETGERAQWRVCFDDGRSVVVGQVERPATEAEVRVVRGMR